ncbi:hypothetical protein IH601_02305, partial [Candidatus Bipolaricaulota bacterium]|nr:hypothetical protein [Candidatus Bipolaricaulota bacterium]
TFSVTLLAMDNEAATDSITKTVKVYNHQPVAGFEISNPIGGHTADDTDEAEYADVAAARTPAGRWTDDNVIMGDLQSLAGPTVNVFIRSRLTTDLDWYTLADTGSQKTLEMSKGLAAPGSTKPVPDDYSATNKAYSYDPEGQYWTTALPAWFPAATGQAWGIQWIYVNWGDGPEVRYDYAAMCNDPAFPTVLYDQDAIMDHTYAYTGGSMAKTITIRVVDFLGGQASFSRQIQFQAGTEGTDDL